MSAAAPSVVDEWLILIIHPGQASAIFRIAFQPPSGDWPEVVYVRGKRAWRVTPCMKQFERGLEETAMGAPVLFRTLQY
jgi:hypothetical protein